MSGFVQAYDPDHRVYRKIHVASGEFVDEQPSPFRGVDEIEALESRKQQQRPGRYDPLGDFR